MKIPNSDRAIIEQSKITEYLLNTKHKRGGILQTIPDDVVQMQRSHIKSALLLSIESRMKSIPFLQR